MIKNTIFTGLTTLILVASSSQSIALEEFEAAQSFNASSILSADLLSGPNHQVGNVVTNDGFLNIYTISSKYGEIQAVSTAKLRKYIHEVNVVAQMKEMQGSNEFKSGMANKAGAVVEGAGALITDPVGTVSDTVSGVGKLFSRAGENIFGGSRSDSEGSRMGSLLGYAKAKREIGYKLGVDVYSHNEILQKELDSLSSAGGTGALVMSGLLMAVPGGAGAAVSVAGGTKLMADLVYWDKSPADLRTLNREKLASMGVGKDVADIFISNGIYTPREQTILVAAIGGMDNTKKRSEYIKFAVLTDNADMAFFRQRQAQMYAAYNKSVNPVKRFITIGDISVAKTKDNKIVFNVPLDYMSWTKGLASIARLLTQEVALMKDVTGREIWVTGRFSPIAKKSLEKMGWDIFENVGASLKIPIY